MNMTTYEVYGTITIPVVMIAESKNGELAKSTIASVNDENKLLKIEAELFMECGDELSIIADNAKIRWDYALSGYDI